MHTYIHPQLLLNLNNGSIVDKTIGVRSNRAMADGVPINKSFFGMGLWVRRAMHCPTSVPCVIHIGVQDGQGVMCVMCNV